MTIRIGRHEAVRGARQWRALERVLCHVDASPAFAGAVLLGSLARGEGDDLSDVDLLLVAVPDGFEQAWAERTRLHGADVLVAWDEPGEGGVGGHAWLERDLVMVECLIAAPGAPVRLAEPQRVVVGPDRVLEGIARRPPVGRDEMSATHDVDAAYDALKRVVRRHRRGDPAT